MKVTDFFRTLCVILIGIAIGLISYKKFKHRTQQKTIIETNALAVKKLLLKFKKPARIEVQSYVKNEKTKFKKDIQDIKQLKVFLDPNSNFFIELQLFTDENDPQAPLVVQCRFLDIKTQNLIQEQSINLFLN
jgi:hypothetical protein